jgi:sensor histidine kinase YesM
MSVHCSDDKVAINIRNGRKNASKGHGIGLENLANQLKHLYAEKFRLALDSDRPEAYSVSLILFK